ncbi:MAG: NADH-quinone oxidoreductase subunit I [Halobacteriovoraceae bacterium]|nr:NADH-quinone oxidoreductase subunit I [Halobacteriovoraceae bacterium]
MNSLVNEPELTFKQYFKNIWNAVSSTFKGLSITIKYVTSVRPVTIEYPEVREILPKNSRSRLFNDVEDCIACDQCAVACPVDCIYIASKPRPKDAEKIKTSNGTPIRRELTQYTIDTALCCYCGLCTTVCPTQSIQHTTDYEFATFTLDQMKYNYIDPEVRAWRERILKDRN